MPNLSKIKKKKATKLVAKPTKNLPTLQKTKSKKLKDPISYYGCLYEQAQTGFPDKITACCSKCKKQGTALSALRKQEIKKLTEAYQQIGISLTKLLEPTTK